MSNYRVSNAISIDNEGDLLYIEGNPFILSKTKAYLIQYFDVLCTKYRIKILWSNGKPRALYAWDNIFQEAYEKMIIPSGTLEKPKTPQTNLF
jgi:hypothetical protein